MGLVAYRLCKASLCLLRRNVVAHAYSLLVTALSMSLFAAPDPVAAQTFLSPQGPTLNQVNQIFNSQGPSPEIGNVAAIGSTNGGVIGSDAGAVQSVLLDPALGSGTMFAASPNGGIWKSTNSGTSWTALTDNQASLSIGSLSLDPTDPTGKTIIAGIGLTDNGLYVGGTRPQSAGGERTGLLYTTNGGATWSTIGLSSPFPESVVSAMARGNTILAATYEPIDAQGSTAGYGLFRSTNGGATFTNMSGAAGSGLPLGAVTSLVADPSSPTTFYAAVKTTGMNANTAVYISTNSGATWSSIFSAPANTTLITSASQTVITLAAGPNGSVAIALSNLDHPKAFTAVFLSGDQGKNWSQLTTAPAVNSGDGQAPQNLHIAIDPTNKNIVYLAGDTSTTGVQLFRINYNPSNGTSAAVSLTTDGTAANNFQDANTAHADSRSITFDQAGNLILSSDGGIYVRTNPQGAGVWEGGTGSWTALNGNLSLFEIYSIAYDANSKRLAIAAQDNNAALQSQPGSNVFNTIGFADGTNVAINDRTLSSSKLSAVYSSFYNLGSLSRMIINAQGQVVSPGTDPINSPGGIPVYCSLNGSGAQDCGDLVNATFYSKFVLNKIDPTLIALTGSGHVYTTSDSLSGTHDYNATSIDLALTDLGPTHDPATAITYGTVNDTRAIAVGNALNGGATPPTARQVRWFSSPTIAATRRPVSCSTPESSRACSPSTAPTCITRATRIWAPARPLRRSPPIFRPGSSRRRRSSSSPIMASMRFWSAVSTSRPPARRCRTVVSLRVRRARSPSPTATLPACCRTGVHSARDCRTPLSNRWPTIRRPTCSPFLRSAAAPMCSTMPPAISRRRHNCGSAVPTTTPRRTPRTSPTVRSAAVH